MVKEKGKVVVKVRRARGGLVRPGQAASESGGPRPVLVRKARAEAIPWGQVETRFVVDGVEAPEIAREFGVSTERVRSRLKKGGWIEKRERYQKELQDRLRKEQHQAVLSARRESLQIVFGMKLLAARTITDRIRNGTLRVSVKDFVDLQRLELDLRAPLRLEDLDSGGAPESADSIVRDQIRVALEERRAALAAAGLEAPPVSADPDGMTELKAFLYGADVALPAPGERLEIEAEARVVPPPVNAFGPSTPPPAAEKPAEKLQD